MASTLTTILQLFKATPGTAEPWDTATQFNSNMDKIDAAVGRVKTVANAAARPGSPVEGQLILQLDDDALYLFSAGAWLPFDTKWQTYTPGWQAVTGTQPTLGTSVLTGRYFRTGRKCDVDFHFAVGTGASGGTAGNIWAFSNPFLAQNDLISEALPRNGFVRIAPAVGEEWVTFAFINGSAAGTIASRAGVHFQAMGNAGGGSAGVGSTTPRAAGFAIGGSISGNWRYRVDDSVNF